MAAPPHERSPAIATAAPRPATPVPPPAPLAECDLVMKGGVTSGVVYPPAVVKLARKYRFRSIGGTSAGAIAAGAAAAAEYGRAQGGFVKFEALGQSLAAEGALLNLFQAPPATRPLLDTIKAALPLVAPLAATQDAARAVGRAPGPVAARWALPHVARLLRGTDAEAFGGGAWRGAALGALLGLLLALALAGLVAALTAVPPGGWLLLVALLALGGGAAWAGWWAGGLLGAGADLLSILVTRLPRDSFYGICTGRGEDAPDGGAPLTDWLTANVNDIAGLAPDGPPLTFADLTSRGVNLRVVTTNLSHGEPYVLPRAKNTFIFQVDEWRRLFPDNVIAHLMQKAPLQHMALPEGYYFLPNGDDLPVVVAIRLSLSAPVLISAVPLYTVRPSALTAYRLARSGGPGFRFDAARDLQLNWFSDGGICSNFPIHFFDRWLPSRPTFGINLTSLPAEPPAPRPAGPAGADRGAPADDDPVTYSVDAVEEATESAGPADLPEATPLDPDIGMQRVFLPRANAPQYPEWKRVQGLPGFLLAVFESAQNYRDTSQARLPSYRERVVQIRLARDEGGINLTMPPATIARLIRLGEEAADALLTEFNFEHHQWVRLRVLMEQLTTQLNGMDARLDPALIGKLLADQARDQKPNFPYRMPSQMWRHEAAVRIGKLRDLIVAWETADATWRAAYLGQATLFFPPPSRAEPEPELRVTPRL